MKKEQLLDMYHQMVLVRRVEERGMELYQAGKIGGFMHLYIGQEAVGTGLIAAREDRDRVITAYRDHGVAIAAASQPMKLWQAARRRSDEEHVWGAGETVHMASVREECGAGMPNHWYLPIAAGLAIRDQYENNDNVTGPSMFGGDGATNIGYFHEALNLSKAWGLRVLWVARTINMAWARRLSASAVTGGIRRHGWLCHEESSQVDGYGRDVKYTRQRRKRLVPFAKRDSRTSLKLTPIVIKGS